MSPIKVTRRAKIVSVIGLAIACLAYFFLAGGLARSTAQTVKRDDAGNQGEQDAFLPVILRPPLSGSLPPCQAHEPTAWHSLIDEEANCHYDHEHKDNPHLLDDVFGSQFYEWAGGSISYPWQTGDGHGENMHKHESYGWVVLRDLPPSLSNSEDGTPSRADTGFIKHLRIQSHLDMSVIGAPTRFHSSYIEVMICYKNRPDDCGIVRYGGHLDYGELRVDGNWVPLPDDPVEYEGVTPPALPEREYDGLIAKRSHSAEENYVTWQGRFYWQGGPTNPIAYSGFDHRTNDAFGPVDPQDLGNIILTDPAVYNNSTHGLVIFVLRMREGDAGEDGRINYFGYANRYGLEVNADCTEPGLDCIPISFENVPAMRGISVRPDTMHEYDTSPPDESWIEYPN